MSSIIEQNPQTSFLLQTRTIQNVAPTRPITLSALPGTLAHFTGTAALKKAALALNPGLDPDDVSEQLKQQGASIPFVRLGKSTAAFIKKVLSWISVLGSAFLVILAAGPAAIEQITHLTAL